MTLVGLHELAEHLNVSKQTLWNWRKRDMSFPQPHWKLKQGPVWDLERFYWKKR